MNNPVFLSVLIGLTTGVVAALCGVGGGIIMVPAFVFLLGLSQKNAVATSLAAIVLTSLAASLKNTSNNLVDWKVAIPTALAAAVAAWFASDLLKTLPIAMLSRIFAVLLIAMGVHMLISAK